ncbi:MAG: TonB-dependent receptor [Bacteroidota bacterium]
MKCIYTLGLFFLLTPLAAQNQQWGNGSGPAGKISGTVVDALTGLPVEFATLSVFRKDSLANGAITDMKGNFSMDKLKFGRYKLKIAFIGYENYEKDSILVTPKAPEVSLGAIRLKPNTKVLGDVNIVTEKDLVQMQIDKKVYDVGQDINAQGGSASDVLQNVPSVQVDVDGNITLRGSGNVTVLIDGKPSAITGDNMATVLKQIPASSIDYVEVITNPSVKYDPDGTSGIINIVLKKNQKPGYNGLLSLSAGWPMRYNASLNFNVRTRRFNFFTNYSYRTDSRDRVSISERKNIFSDTVFYFNNYGSSMRRSVSHLAKAGFDYYINDKTTIGITGTYSIRTSLDTGSTEYNYFDLNKALTDIYFRETSEDETGDDLNLTLDFRKLFSKPKQELTSSITYSADTEDELNAYHQQDYYLDYTPSPSSPFLQSNSNLRKVANLSAQADYVQPVKETGKFETGLKYNWREIDNDISARLYDTVDGAWENDTLITNHFIFNEQLFSGYASYNSSFKKFGYQLGLRVEQAMIVTDNITLKQKVNNDYFSFYPSLHVSYSLPKDQQLQVSYSRRVNRPGVNQLNGWTNYSDPLNIRKGNPLLKPEYINSFEAGYSKFWEKHTFIGNAYYKQTVDMIQRVRTVDSLGIATTNFANINSAQSYGVDLTLRSKLYKWWTFTANFNFFQTVIDGGESELNNEGYSWFVKGSMNFTFWKNTQLQLSGNYNAPTPSAQGTVNAMYSVDAGAKKDIMKGKGSLALNCNDVFNTRRFSMTAYGDNFENYMMHRWASRVVTFTFSYRFGNADFQPKKEKKQDFQQQQPDMDF